MADELTDEQKQRLLSLKQWRPFRICWAAVKGEEFILHATVTRHRLNRLAKEGYTIYIADHA